jgi:hypothetical protein
MWTRRRCSYEGSTVATVVAWSIWKRRNALVFYSLDEDVFYSLDEDLPTVVRQCIDDIRLWAFRCSSLSSKTLYWNLVLVLSFDLCDDQAGLCPP